MLQNMAMMPLSSSILISAIRRLCPQKISCHSRLSPSSISTFATLRCSRSLHSKPKLLVGPAHFGQYEPYLKSILRSNVFRKCINDIFRPSQGTKFALHFHNSVFNCHFLRFLYPVHLKSKTLLKLRLKSTWCDSLNPNHVVTPYQDSTQTATPQPDLKREIWRVVRKDWPLLILVVLTAIIAAMANLWLPRVTGDLVNVISKAVADTGSYISWVNELNKPAAKLLGLFALKGFLTFLHISLVTLLGESLSRRLRQQLFTSLIYQDIAFFDEKRTGELVGRVSADIAEFKHTFKQCVTQGLKSVTEILGSVAHLIHLSPSLSLTLSISMPILYVFGNIYGHYLRKLSRQSRVYEGEASAVASEALSNIRTVKSYAAEDREIDMYLFSIDQAYQGNIKLGVHIGLFQAMTTTSIGSMILIVLYYGGSLVTQGKLKPGELMSYLMSTQATQKSLALVGVLLGQVIKGMATAQRVFEYIHVHPTIPTSGGIVPNDITGDIQFRNINFTYPTRPDQPVLQNFNLTIPHGKVVALCGSSGSGKSTVAMLIERFYDPDVSSGGVFLDGRDLRTLDVNWLRQNIGYISQQPTLFGTSILENIRYGKPGATLDEVKEAARKANAAEFIEGFPDGYDTVVGERGVALSGGQRQRIAIAAAILKDPKVLILDEATSALDTQSERLVQDALDKLMKGRTVLVIAHRLTTIQNADLIVVMGKTGGNIIEMGRHDHLMARKGLYYQLNHAGVNGLG
ncbi:P-loop containing nucleoside triphosphate hydrolase protein [Paraphysoderma sedebokerense]|nr:P-loop containing nucleoside triphosphate hydrolase protein [Paraphysoderma sedebokerense]